MTHRQIPIVSPTKRHPPAGSVTSPGSLSLTALPPLSLYVHVPWCVRKCPYCDFNSHTAPEKIPEDLYLDALAADLEQALPDIWGRQVHSVFIGGGTPSLLSDRAVDRVLSLLRAYLNVWPDAEITLEANPGTVEASKFKAYAAAGINRISLGIQSFDDTKLHALGRIHDQRQAMDAIEIAMRAVPRVNLDLMYGLPGQSIDECEQDVRQAMSFGTDHLSLYQLTLEPSTVFAKFPPALPDEVVQGDMEDMLVEMTAQGGLERYEVSAYARPGQQCRHNRNYWEFGDYLGIGPGAHGKISFPNRIERHAKLRNPESWIQSALKRDQSHLAEKRVVSSAELPFEFMLNALRLKQGVPAHFFQDRTGLSIATIRRQIDHAVSQGLLASDPTRFVATPQGWHFLNDLHEIFL